MAKFLLTSVGSLVGQNLLDVIEVYPDDIRVIGMTSMAAIPLSRCERVYLAPPTEEPPSAFSRQLLDIIDRERPDLVIPTRDRDVTVLAQLAATDPELAQRTPCGPAEIAMVLEDKWLSYLFARNHGLPFAESAVAEPASGNRAAHQLAQAVGYPLVAKPRIGFGSRRVWLLTTAEQLEAALAEADMMIQRYIGPAALVEGFQADVRRQGMPIFHSLEQDKYSLQTYLYRNGTFEPMCCTRHRMKQGFSVNVERITDEPLAATGEGWAIALAAAGWRGPLNIQCQKNDEGDFVSFELNGRFTGATAARYYLGHDELGCLIQDRLGRAAPLKHAAGDLSPIKYYRTIAVGRADVETLERHGRWARDGGQVIDGRQGILHPETRSGTRLPSDGGART